MQISNYTQKLSNEIVRLAPASAAIRGHNTNPIPMGTLQIPIGLALPCLRSFLGLCRKPTLKPLRRSAQIWLNLHIRSISIMARTNRYIHVSSLVNLPHLGSRFEGKWCCDIPLVAGIRGAHLALFVLKPFAT